MAVDTETVQETDAATEQAAADSTIQTTEQDAAAVAETQTDTAAQPAAEEAPTQTATAEVASGIPAWDHERARRNEEAAEKRKALIRKEVAEQVAEALARGVTPAQQQQATDDASDIQKLLDDAERLSDEAQKKAEEDPYESAKLSAAASKAAAQANRKMLELNKQQAAVIKAREADEARKATVSAEWQAFHTANPEVPIQKAQELADECYKLASDGGYEGPALRKRADEFFQQKLPALKKKSSTPASQPTQQPRRTAPPTSASAPAGTQVIPATSGARKDATQLTDVAKRFAAHFRKQS